MDDSNSLDSPADERYTPLSAPEIRADIPDAGVGGWWAKVPIVGWMVKSNRWNKRFRPTIARINSILRSRPKPGPEIWGDNLARTEMAQWLCKKIADEMSWANDHFVPDDPCYVLLWAHVDGLDLESLWQEIEGYLDLTFTAADVSRWLDLSLGELVDLLLLRHMPADQWPPPPTRPPAE